MTEKKSSEQSDMVSFYKKLNEMRAEALTLDWETDKFVPLGGNKGYHYISIYKMKRNLAPLFAKHKIEFIPNYYNIELKQVGNGFHWIVCLEARMIDTETGYESSAHSIGAAPAMSDKSVSIAKAFALKEWMSDQYFLTDGMIDPDEGDVTPAKSYSKKDPKEEEAAKSKILAKSIRPLEVKEPEEKEEVAEETPAEVEETPVAAELPLDYEPEDKEGVPTPQMNAIKNIFRVRTQWVKAGKMTALEWNTMSSEFTLVDNGQKAVDFIKKYRVV